MQSDQSSLIACAFYGLQTIQREINENPCHTGLMYRLSHIGLVVAFAVPLARIHLQADPGFVFVLFSVILDTSSTEVRLIHVLKF